MAYIPSDRIEYRPEYIRQQLKGMTKYRFVNNMLRRYFKS